MTRFNQEDQIVLLKRGMKLYFLFFANLKVTISQIISSYQTEHAKKAQFLLFEFCSLNSIPFAKKV